MLRASKVFQHIKDCLFPIFCFGCGKEGEWLCRLCMDTIDTRGVFACPTCHREMVSGICCESCKEKSALFQESAVVRYQEETPLGSLIRAYKYRYAEEAFLVFEELIRRFVSDRRNIFSSVETIVPVPLHPRRYAERGFNQAEAIAECLSSHLAIPRVSLLKRTRFTKQQATLSRKKRKENVRGAFAPCDASRYRLETVLLVDDVFTTGSTMQECARILHASGVREVRGFTLARG